MKVALTQLHFTGALATRRQEKPARVPGGVVIGKLSARG